MNIDVQQLDGRKLMADAKFYESYSRWMDTVKTVRISNNQIKDSGKNALICGYERQRDCPSSLSAGPFITKGEKRKKDMC